MQNGKPNFIKKITIFSLTMAISVQAGALGLTTDTIYASNFETGINIPALFIAEHNAVFSEDFQQYTNLPNGTNITGRTLTMYDVATSTWITPPAWVGLENPLNLEGVAEDMGTIALKAEITTDNASYPVVTGNFDLKIINDGGGTVNTPPTLVIEAHVLDGTTPFPVDETDPYNQGADYTLPASLDLVIDTTNSTDPNDPNNPNDDGTVVHLNITSNISGVIHDGDVQSVMIPRIGGPSIEELTIEITDNGGKKTVITKRVARP